MAAVSVGDDLRTIAPTRHTSGHQGASADTPTEEET
jgi:hypothetical protein